MEYWINFAVVGFAELVVFIVCAFCQKSSDVPRILWRGVLTGIVVGLLSDFALRGKFTYPLGYGWFYLILNAAVVYGLFAATVLLLQRARPLNFSLWIIITIAVYEITNHVFLVWTYTVTSSFLGLLAFLIVGYFVTAIFIASLWHIFFGYRFSFIDNLLKK